jgi:CRISPR-associated protein Csx3
MVALLPAVMIGGPPNMGKSVLTYGLTQKLRELQIDHYVIRAHPDGEGDWFQEIEPEQVRQIRIKGRWTDEFVRYICADLDRRLLPLLVDVGGLPTQKQTSLFRHCTHSILLLPANNEATAEFWRHKAEINGLLPLAYLASQLDGISAITAEVPVIEGTLTGLRRRTTPGGALFDLLVARLVSLLNYHPTELRKIHLDAAPAELVVDLNTFLHAWAPETRRWKPEMVSRLLAELPTDVPLAVYGRAPGWLYGALVMQTGPDPFYQFDPRLGWVVPPPLQMNSEPLAEIEVGLSTQEQATVLAMNIPTKYLDYTQAEHLHFPPVATERGLIFDGPIPHWLLTALVRLYSGTGVAWIACYQPQLKGAVVVTSRAADHVPGDFVTLPVS